MYIAHNEISLCFASFFAESMDDGIVAS